MGPDAFLQNLEEVRRYMDEMLKFQGFFQKLGGVGTLGINYVVCFSFSPQIFQ